MDKSKLLTGRQKDVYAQICEAGPKGLGIDCIYGSYTQGKAQGECLKRLGSLGLIKFNMAKRKCYAIEIEPEPAKALASDYLSIGDKVVFTIKETYKGKDGFTYYRITSEELQDTSVRCKL